MKWPESYDLVLFSLGLILRYSLYSFQELIPWTVKYLVVHPIYQDNFSEECRFRTERNLNINRSYCLPSYFIDRFFVGFSGFYFAIVLQIITFILMRKLSSSHGMGKGPTIMYWTSPIICISATFSPISSFFHLLILSVAVALQHKAAICALGLTTLLSVLRHEFYPLFIPVIYNISSWYSLSKSHRTHSVAAFLGLLLLALLHCGCWWYHSELSSSTRVLEHGDIRREHLEYFPSLGVGWYLEAQIFSTYREYFSSLMSAQPYLYALPLCQRLPLGPSSQTAFFVLVAVVFLFGPLSGLSDLLFIASCLARHSDVVALMRHKELLCGVIVLTIAASPLMLTLWVDTGTGNANYLFFQSVAMCVSYVFLLVEFLRCAMKLRKTTPSSVCA